MSRVFYHNILTFTQNRVKSGGTLPRRPRGRCATAGLQHRGGRLLLKLSPSLVSHLRFISQDIEQIKKNSISITVLELYVRRHAHRPRCCRLFAHDTRGCSAAMDCTISQATAEEFVLKVKLSKAIMGIDKGGRGPFVVVRQPHEIVTTTRSLVHLTNPFARSHRPFAVDRSEDRQVCAKAFLMSTSHPNFKFYAECSRSAGRRSQESAEVTFIVIALNNILYNHCYNSFHSTTLR